MTEVQPSPSLPDDWWLRIGHDLRGPIAPMRMAVQVLRSNRMGSEEREQALELLDRQIDTLVSVISDVNDLLRVNAGTFSLNPEPADLNLLFDLLEGSGPLARMLLAKRQVLDLRPADAPLIAVHDAHRTAMLLKYLVTRLASRAAPGAALSVALAPEASGFAEFRLHAPGAGPGDDLELAYVAGVDAGADELESRAILIREIARLSGIGFSSIDFETGLSFRMPIRAS